ncbi:hypothetical protein ACHWQZ_G007533 [Mnemiopsis leidyi]
MLPCSNEITDMMDDMVGCGYKEMYMRQIVDARDAIFAEMCKELKIENHHHIQRCYLNKSHITKEKLIRWLETVCFILDSNAVPLLYAGSEKLEAVVKKVTVTEEMSKNAIVYGLVETEHETLLKKVEEVLAEIGEKPNLTSCSRVGTKRDNAIRPVKITLKSIDHVNQILRNAKILHTKTGYSGIYICPDRTAEQRKADKRLWEQLKTKRKTEPEKDHRIRNGRLVSSEKDSKPAVSNVECPLCGHHEETVNHFLGQCPDLAQTRGQYFNDFYLSANDIFDNIHITTIINYVNCNKTRRLMDPEDLDNTGVT